MIEQLFTIFEICIKLFSELVLTPFLNIIHHRLPSKDDEITISINISPAGQRQRDASASSGASGPMKRPPVKKSVTFEEVQIRTYESILGECIIHDHMMWIPSHAFMCSSFPNKMSHIMCLSHQIISTQATIHPAHVDHP